MANKDYFFAFGGGINPSLNSGLSPTFIVFRGISATATAPVIAELPSASGIYYFAYGCTNGVAFVIDGTASVTNPNFRYVAGSLDPVQLVDQVLGTTASSYGTTATDPTTVMGYAKRSQEWNEGNSVFGKQSGLWDVYSRGSSTLLAEKTITDASGSSNVLKT